ncbi:glycosyltransferase family 2 protein [Horticoccus sp. 23ND18S-11]|uniref:glycosyltransferase family 2 protein n=1 Tax=Horticoccus sp. 23ND18S-11 TaxID=3391832 RepID=UPI0039C997E6
MKPRVSVIIPCYNYGRFIREAIDSVLSAGRDDVEIIVVDDGSTDRETQIEMDRLVSEGFHVIRQTNAGLATARNVAITAAAADLILPLDADNRVRPAFFERALAIMEKDAGTGVVYGDAQKFGSRTDRWHVGPFDRIRLMRVNYIDACALLRRVVWEQHGGYDVNMPIQGLEDWDLWLGTMSRGWKFSYVNEILFDYRVESGSMSAKPTEKMAALEAYIATKYGTLYRDAWMEMQRDLFSVRATGSHFLSLLTRRVTNKFRPARFCTPVTWREAVRPAR